MNKLLAAAALALVAAPVAAANYVTDTATFTGVGDSLGTMFDIVTLNGVAGSATTSGTYLVNTVDFTVGVNASAPGGPFTGTFTDTATVDGSPFSYSVPYSILINSSDTITIGGNTVHFDGIKVHFNTLTFSNVGGGSTVSGDLTATVSVPEPATWAMMVAGFGLVGFSVRRRRTTVAA